MSRVHYEMAFEAHLEQIHVPFVRAEAARRHVVGQAGLKFFDYVVYPPTGRAILVDVKGRKRSDGADRGRSGFDTWVTRRDLDGLSGWRQVFGPNFDAGFVFSYWWAGPSAPRRGLMQLAGRSYSFLLILLPDYLEHQRERSPRWGTVHLRRDSMMQIARVPEECWTASRDPCRAVGATTARV
ncbi:MAG: HYExAFE family protein [Phycisphaerae bacterium]|nr:HYExAFE family protein [Phycisphaerae bacterium]